MKRSNQILKWTLFTVFALIFVMTAASRMWVKWDTISPEAQAASGQSYDLKAFDHIHIAHGFRVNIIHQEEFSIHVNGPDLILHNLIVKKQKNQLILDHGPSDIKRKNPIKVKIGMPELSQVDLEGASRGEIAGFSLPNLVMNLKGASHAEGSDNHIEQLRLNLRGAASVDFEDSHTVHAEINATGASSARLEMTGGNLTGTLTQASHVKYSGDVSEISVLTNDVAEVKTP